MTERWISIPGWESEYEVSDLGRVRSLERILHVRNRWGPIQRRYGGGMLKQHLNLGGYPIVVLSSGNRGTTKKVANLVALAFLGPKPFPRAAVCHSDGDKMNSRLSNLRYDTYSANEQDKIAHGGHWQVNKTHCPQGHPYDEENTYINPSTGGRSCRICTRVRNASRRPPPTPRPRPEHGTLSRYVSGCRCDECRATQRAYDRERRRRKRDEAA